jgi:hypothetical protein
MSTQGLLAEAVLGDEVVHNRFRRRFSCLRNVRAANDTLHIVPDATGQ